MTLVDRPGAMPTNLETLSALVRDLSADEQLVDDVSTAARAQSPELARLPWIETRRHVAALLSAGFTAFLHAGDPDEEDFAEAVHYGAEPGSGGALACHRCGASRTARDADDVQRAAREPGEGDDGRLYQGNWNQRRDSVG